MPETALCARSGSPGQWRPGQPEEGEIPVPAVRLSGPGVFRGTLVGALPQEPPGFQARADLLAELDRAAMGRPAVHAVTGRRGAGTTQLAAAYTRARLTAGWRLVAWVNAENRRTLLTGLAAVADATGLSVCAGRGGDAGLAVRHRLETDGERCLLVFDGADDPEALRRFVPATGAARVLITGHRQAVAKLGIAVQVDVFTADKAVAFLVQRTGLADAEGAAAVAAELGYLPLALAQAAAVIAGQQRGYRTYLDRLWALRTEAYPARGHEQPYPHGVAAAAVLLSLEMAGAGDQADVRAGVMELMAVLSAAGVRRDLLHAAAEAGVLPVGGSAAGVRADLVDRALTELAGVSLLTFGMDGGTLIAHQLVARVVRDGLARQGRLAAVCRAAASVLEMRAEALRESSDRAAVRDITEQVAALLDHSAGSADAELAKAMLRLRWLALAHLVELDDSMPQAITAGELLTADFERIAGPDHPGTLRSRDSLAVAYQAAGRAAEAVPLLERTLAARERFLGPDHPGTATSWDNLGLAYQAVGRAGEAIRLHERALAARERLLGPDHPDTLASRDNLASAHRDAGRPDEAIRLHERALAAYQRVLGPDHLDTIACRDNLALAYWAAGRAVEAIPLFERALAARARVLGADHPDTLTSRSNLAAAYWAAGRAVEAIPLHERALAARERLLGPDHPDTLTSRNNLAAAYMDAGRAAEAIPLFERTLADRTRVLGPCHPRTQTSQDNLVIARSRHGRIS
jgi:tetratricopeptide (TPR) repeat protein